jgi:ubiquinone/menaquinone biosynthesis C-methylase UbiE
MVKNVALDYTDEAPVYDQKRYDSLAGNFYVELTNDLISELIDLKPNDRILDVATGTGRVAVGQALRGADVDAVDLTPAMLNRAREKADAAGAKIRFQRADAFSLPFQENTFDAVISTRFFHLLPPDTYPALLQEMVRVAKPGGKLVVEWNTPFCNFLLKPFWGGQPSLDPRIAYRLVEKATRRVRAIRGLMFPGFGHIARLNNRLASTLATRLNRFPIAHLCTQYLVVGEK